MRFEKVSISFVAFRIFAIVFVPNLFDVSHVRGQDLLFSDDFEGNLSQWTGKGGSSHQGVIVEDPLDSGNQVLTFTGLNDAGDMFGSGINVTAAQTVILSFDYLGLAEGGSIPDDLGGFIGYSEGLYDPIWVAGTRGAPYPVLDLIDDGNWHRYVITLPYISDTFRIVLEDYSSSGGIPGDAYFDNVEVTPEPSTLTLLVLGSLILLRKRRA